MFCNTFGQIARAEWVHLEERFLGVKLDEFVFMPNHMHGIIMIPKKTNIDSMPERFQKHMQTLAEERHPELKKPYRPPSLGMMIRAFKGATTRKIRVAGLTNFAWENNYFSKIINSNAMLQNERRYIQENPAKWMEDEFYGLEPGN